MTALAAGLAIIGVTFAVVRAARNRRRAQLIRRITGSAR